MAAVIIPGLTVALGQTDLVETNRLYNTLAEVDDQPDVSSEHLNALAQIFVKHGMHETFGVHLVHAHSRIEEDKVMLGYWTKPAKMNEIKLSEVRGRIFKVLDSTCFVAYEFTEGPITDMSSCPVEFFKEVTNFLLEKGLADILALEVWGNCAEDMVELDLTELGTVMLKDALLRADLSLTSLDGSFLTTKMASRHTRAANLTPQQRKVLTRFSLTENLNLTLTAFMRS